MVISLLVGFALVTALLFGGLSVVAVLLGGGTAVFELQQRRRLVYRMGEQLSLAGLEPDRVGWTGAWGGRTVRVQVRHGERIGFGVAVEVPSGTLEVYRRSLGRGHPVGDPGFDERWRAAGALADRALLSAHVRQVIGRMGSRLWISDGWVGWELDGEEALRPGELQEVLRGLAWVADPFWDAPTDPEDRFEQLVLEDPEPTVRWRTLVALEVEQPALAVRLAARVAADPDPRVRWAAGRLLASGEVLASVCGDHTASDGVRRCAALDLVRLQAPRVQLRVAAALAPEAVPGLRRCAALLATAAGPDGEACLLALIDDSRGSVVRAAAEGLARVGSARSVPVLREVVDRSSRLGTLYPVIRAALDRLRARSAVQIGALTLASTEGGGLSEIDAPGGGLSLAP